MRKRGIEAEKANACKEEVMPMQGWYDRRQKLCAADVDENGEWRASSIFVAMQEAGGEQCENSGFGVDALRARNLAWVLSRLHLHMERVPVLNDEITVRTWAKSPQHFFCPRYYAIYVGEERVGVASALYVQFDLTQRKMTKPWVDDAEWLQCELEPPTGLPGNLPRWEEEPALCSRVARYSDLDFNRHVNNTRYLDWFGDCFDDAFHRQYRLRDVLVHYNREILPDEAVELQVRRRGDETLVQGYFEGNNCFGIHGVWQARAEKENR